MTDANYEVDLPEQKVNCTLAQHKGGNPYAVEISIAPKVAFGGERPCQLGGGESADASLRLDLCRH